MPNCTQFHTLFCDIKQDIAGLEPKQYAPPMAVQCIVVKTLVLG